MRAYLRTKFQASSITLAGFRRGNFHLSPTSRQTPKKPTQIRVKVFLGHQGVKAGQYCAFSLKPDFSLDWCVIHILELSSVNTHNKSQLARNGWIFIFSDFQGELRIQSSLQDLYFFFFLKLKILYSFAQFYTLHDNINVLLQKISNMFLTLSLFYQ